MIIKSSPEDSSNRAPNNNNSHPGRKLSSKNHLKLTPLSSNLLKTIIKTLKITTILNINNLTLQFRTLTSLKTPAKLGNKTRPITKLHSKTNPQVSTSISNPFRSTILLNKTSLIFLRLQTKETNKKISSKEKNQTEKEDKTQAITEIFSGIKNIKIINF
jgi:hypothetical protein